MLPITSLCICTWNSFLPSYTHSAVIVSIVYLKSIQVAHFHKVELDFTFVISTVKGTLLN